MKKLILFDWENVLLDSDSSVYSVTDAQNDIISELKPKDKQTLKDLFNLDTFWTTSEGNLCMLIRLYLIKSGCACTVDDFKACYLKHYQKIPWFDDTVAFLNTMAEDDRFCIGILSTLCEMDLELLRSKILMDKLDYRFFSFNLRTQKPKSQIYEIAEIVTGRQHHDILFIDDRKDNINTAVKRGWKTVLTTGAQTDDIRKECYSFMDLVCDKE